MRNSDCNGKNLSLICLKFTKIFREIKKEQTKSQMHFLDSRIIFVTKWCKVSYPCSLSALVGSIQDICSVQWTHLCPF